MQAINHLSQVSSGFESELCMCYFDYYVCTLYTFTQNLEDAQQELKESQEKLAEANSKVQQLTDCMLQKEKVHTVKYVLWVFYARMCADCQFYIATPVMSACKWECVLQFEPPTSPLQRAYFYTSLFLCVATC